MSEKWYVYHCKHCDFDGRSRTEHASCDNCGNPASIRLIRTVPNGYYDQSRIVEWKCDECDKVHALDTPNSEELIYSKDCITQGCDGKMGRYVKGVPFTSTASLAMGDAASAPAIDKWQKQREEKRKIEERTLREHGSL